METAGNDDVSDSPVVMRRSSRQAQEAAAKVAREKQKKDEQEGIRRVKWSESTDLRERMKEYRRSQMDVCLDYQHIAVDEERERDGVKLWRNKLSSEDAPEEEDERGQSGIDQEGEALEGDSTVEEDDTDSEDEASVYDEALEDRLRVIKTHSSRMTLQPAYIAAIQTYQDWFASDDNTSSLSQEQLEKMKAQLDLYKQIVALVQGMEETDPSDKLEATSKELNDKVSQAKQLLEPPEPVTQVLNAELNKKEHVEKQMQLYNKMINDMVINFSTGVMI